MYSATLCISMRRHCQNTEIKESIIMPETYERTLPHVNVGTLGHLNHGKSTLTVALNNSLAKKHGGSEITVADMDQRHEEKATARTVKAFPVEYSTASRHYAHIDAPGHEDYTKRVVSAAAIMDAAVLVVSSKDGIQAQTREHIILAKQANVARLAVFINLFDEETEGMDKMEKRLTGLLSKSGFKADESTIIKGSALKAVEGDEASVTEVLKLADYFDSTPAPSRELEKPFFMPITAVIYDKSLGTVAHGKVEEGCIKAGEEVEILGFNKEPRKVTCISLMIFGKSTDGAQAGDLVNILLSRKWEEPKKGAMKRGMAICKPGSRSVHTKFTVNVDVLSTREGGRSTPFGGKYKPTVYCHTWNCGVTMTELDRGSVAPGTKDVSLTMTIHKPMCVDVGAQVSIRDDAITVATGVVTEILN